QNDGDGTITVLPMQGLARRAAANRPLLSEPWQLPQAIGPQDLLVSVIRQVVRDEDGSDRHHLRFQMHHGRDRHEKTVEIGWLEDHSDNTSANRPANDGVT
ncbi:MAG: hypothetical protein KKI08_21125, partial [Armatimonadetes bacterium]|nr:hypothetical protein [Armatimonadota bacterium]